MGSQPFNDASAVGVSIAGAHHYVRGDVQRQSSGDRC